MSSKRLLQGAFRSRPPAQLTRDVYPAEAGSDVLDQAGGAAEAVRSNGKAAARAPVLSMSLARLRPAASSVR